MKTTTFFDIFNNTLEGVRNLPIAACMQTTFYQVNDYFVLRRKAAAARLSDGALYTPPPPSLATKLATLRVRANTHAVRVFNFQKGIVEVKRGQFKVHPNRGGHIQLINLQNRICM